MFQSKQSIIALWILGLCVCLAQPQFVAAAKELESKDLQTSTDPIISSVVSPEVLKEIHRLEEKYPEKGVGQPKYQRSGHQFTTYIVARAAGFKTEESYRLAFFSQLPDDEIQFSATLASFYVFDLEYRKQIMAILHSLHGGGNAEVLKRRQVLRDLIYDGVKNKSLEDYQIGILIHAYADAYSHTTVDDGKLRAFGYTVGHLFHGHKPDLIAYDPERYKEYACELYKVLSLDSNCSHPELKELFQMIERLKKSRDTELPKFETYARNKWFFNDTDYEQKSKQWQNSVKREDMQRTISIIEGRIQSK